MEIATNGPEELAREAGDLDELIEELGAGSGRVMVYRLRKESGSGREFVTQVPGEEFSLLGLQESYGGGEYVIDVREGGKYRVRNRRISIAQPVRPVVPVTQSAPGPDPVQAALLEALRDLKGNQQAPQVNPMEMMAQTLTMVTGLLTPLMERAAPAAPANSMAEALAMIQAVKELSKEDSGFGKVKELLEVSKLLERDGGKDRGGIVDLVIEAAPTVLAMLEQARAQGVQAAAPTQPAPPVRQSTAARPLPAAAAPATAEAAPPEAKPIIEEEDSTMFKLRALLPLAINAAKKAGADEEKIEATTDAYAELIVSGCPEAQRQELHDLVMDDRCLERLAEVDPRVLDLPEWFGELRECIVDQFYPGRLIEPDLDAKSPATETEAAPNAVSAIST